MGVQRLAGITLYFIGIWLWPLILIWFIHRGLASILPSPVLWILLGYVIRAHIKTDPWPELRSWSLWEWARGKNWFNFVLHGDIEGRKLMEREMGDDDSVKESIIWAIYPHGHYSVTIVLWWLLNPAFKRARGAAHSTVSMLPVFRLFMQWLECITVSESDMKRALTQGGGGGQIFMNPGGIVDAGNAGDIITMRKGFLRVAKETGATVVPVWCPDERHYYREWQPLGRSLVPWLRFPFPTIMHGRILSWIPIFLPYIPETGSRIYVGRPMRWDKGETLEGAFQVYQDTIRELQTKAGTHL